MSVKTRRASVFFSARTWIDFFRRSRRNWCSAIASSPFRSRISTDRLAVEVGPELIHHQFFDVFAHEFDYVPGCEWLAVSAAGRRDAGARLRPRPGCPGSWWPRW